MKPDAAAGGERTSKKIRSHARRRLSPWLTSREEVEAAAEVTSVEEVPMVPIFGPEDGGL